MWYPPQPGRKYLQVIDPAGGGTDGDYAAVQVIEQRTGIAVRGTARTCRPRNWRNIVRNWQENINQALLVVERNNHGMAVLAYLNTVEHIVR